MPFTARRYGHGQSWLPACRGACRNCVGGKDAAALGSTAIAAASKAISFFPHFFELLWAVAIAFVLVQRISRGLFPRSNPPAHPLVQRALAQPGRFVLRRFRAETGLRWPKTRVFFGALLIL